MLYARTTNKEHIPLGWEEVEYLFKRLHRLAYVNDGAYQMEWERRMFIDHEVPLIRLSLVRWGRYKSVDAGTPRELIATATKPDEMVPVLLMLIAVAEDKEKEMRAKGDSDVVQWNKRP